MRRLQTSLNISIWRQMHSPVKLGLPSFRNATISVAFFEHRVDFPAKLERKSIVIKLRQFHVFIVNLLWRVYPYRTLLTFMIFAFLSWSLCLDIWLIGKGKYWPDSTLAGQPN